MTPNICNPAELQLTNTDLKDVSETGTILCFKITQKDQNRPTVTGGVSLTPTDTVNVCL